VLFVKADGAAWNKERVAPHGAASKAAELSPPAKFHDLRRSYNGSSISVPIFKQEMECWSSLIQENAKSRTANSVPASHELLPTIPRKALPHGAPIIAPPFSLLTDDHQRQPRRCRPKGMLKAEPIAIKVHCKGTSAKAISGRPYHLGLLVV
jgi:hypothetical protein